MLVRRLDGPRGSHGVLGPLDELRRDMDRLIGALSGEEGRIATAGVFPPMNVTQDADTYFLRVELPGIDPKKLEIATLKNRIAISGERKLAEEKSEVSYHRREREGGRFSRSLVLPSEIDAERVHATYRHGVLSIALPKAAAAKPKQITVSSR